MAELETSSPTTRDLPACLPPLPVKLPMAGFLRRRRNAKASVVSAGGAARARSGDSPIAADHRRYICRDQS